jgi:hypothetical protein
MSSSFDLRLARFVTAYIECALWSSTDESNDQGGDPLDKNFNINDLADECREAMAQDCETFVNANASDIEACEGAVKTQSDVFSRAGHDFWLNRNGHGCGFWDGDWPEPEASRLDAAAEAFGEVNLYVSDDGRIYQT